jgi:hypothetical protein
VGVRGTVSDVVDAPLRPIKLPFSRSTVHPTAACGRVRSDRGEMFVLVDSLQKQEVQEAEPNAAGGSSGFRAARRASPS